MKYILGKITGDEQLKYVHKLYFHKSFEYLLNYQNFSGFEENLICNLLNCGDIEITGITAKLSTVISRIDETIHKNSLIFFISVHIHNMVKY